MCATSSNISKCPDRWNAAILTTSPVWLDSEEGWEAWSTARDVILLVSWEGIRSHSSAADAIDLEKVEGVEEAEGAEGKEEGLEREVGEDLRCTSMNEPTAITENGPARTEAVAVAWLEPAAMAVGCISVLEHRPGQRERVQVR